jgi:hypothetical protein
MDESYVYPASMRCESVASIRGWEGTECFRLEYNANGVLHADNVPAVEYLLTCGDIERCWYKNGKRHRDGGPAVRHEYDDHEYYDHEPPRVTRSHWYKNGNRHRIGGPAIEDNDGGEWYVLGVRHRDDGPAVIEGYREEWWVGGVRIG